MYQEEYFKLLKQEAIKSKFHDFPIINTKKNKYFMVVKTIDYVKYAFIISSKRSTTYGSDFEGLVAESYFEKRIEDTYRILKKEYRDLIERDIGTADEVIWQDFGESARGTVARIFIRKDSNTNKLDSHIKWHLNIMDKLLEIIQKYINIINDKSNNISIQNNKNLIGDIETIIGTKLLINTEKENLIKCRIGQGSFRDKLIKYWVCCSVTKFKEHAILIASHIKPWRDSNNEERLDHFNGLLLTPNLDKLFDNGYISFDDNGKILISNKLRNYEILGINKNMKINIHKKHKKYLEFHRNKIFI